ncbi:cation diffusion facilitator family transporter [Serinicoccus kebangsaanensis]|uniref:cation diffusion facilitator family transporter n=1 Tax=Serinicoccus kebangsaanensis TaxID=2602069 RepID=UPI00124E726E|nr:cation diffusion facilitator family transporter [Serinicoccus kebangsaanensis]
MSAEHRHDHAAGASSTRLLLAFLVTAVILVAEVVGAIITGSLALLVDAGHMLTDAGGLLIALTAARLMARPPSERRTWGFARAEVLGAGAQATVLLGVGIYAIVEGVQRLLSSEPGEVTGGLLLVFGVVGLLGNIVAMLILAGGRDSNLNLRAAFLEVVADALGSVAVIVSAVLIQTQGWVKADAIAGLLIALLIIPRAVSILREAGSVLLESVPPGLDLAEVRDHILEVDHVVDVHDLHASRIGTGTPVLTAHVVVEEGCFRDGHAPQMLDALQACVADHFDVSVDHSTFQLEPPRHTEHEHSHHP